MNNCCHDCVSLFLNCCDSANVESVCAAVRTQSYLRIRRYLRQGFDVNTLLAEYDTTLLYASVALSDDFSDRVKQFHESIVIEYNPSNSVNGMGQNGLLYYLMTQKRRVQECLRYEDLMKIDFLVHQCGNQVLQADVNGTTALAVSIKMLKTDDIILCDRLLQIYETCCEKELKKFKDIAFLKKLVRDSCEHIMYIDIAEINKISYSERMYNYIKLKCAHWLMKCSTALQGKYVRDLESHNSDSLYSMAIKVFYLMSHFIDSSSGSYAPWKEDYADYIAVLQEMIFMMTKKNEKMMNNTTTITLSASTGSDVLTTTNESSRNMDMKTPPPFPRQHKSNGNPYYMVTRKNFQWMLCVGPVISYSIGDLRKIYDWASVGNLWLPLDFREESIQSNSVIVDERKEQEDADDATRSSSISSITMTLALMSFDSQTVSTAESAQRSELGRRSKKSTKSSSKYRKRLASKSVMNAMQNNRNAYYQLNSSRFTKSPEEDAFNDLPFFLLVKVLRMKKGTTGSTSHGNRTSDMFQISVSDDGARDIFHLLTDHVFAKMTRNYEEESYKKQLSAVNEASTSRNLLSIAFEFKEFFLVSYLVDTLKISLARALMPISKQVVCSDGYGEPTKIVYQPAPIYDLLRIDDRTGMEGIKQIWNYLENHVEFQDHLRAQYTYRTKGNGIQAYMTSMPCKNVRLDNFIYFDANGKYPLAWKIYPMAPTGYFIREMMSYYARIDYSKEVDYSLVLKMTSQYRMKIWNRFQETSNCIDMQNKILWNSIVDLIMLNNSSPQDCRNVFERLIEARLFEVRHDADNNNNTQKNDISIDPSIIANIFHPNYPFEKALTVMRFLLFGDRYNWQDEVRAHVRTDNKLAWTIIKSAVQSDKSLSPQLIDFLKTMLFKHTLLNLKKCSWVLLGFFELLHWHPKALTLIALIHDNVEESVWLSMLDRSNRLCHCGPHFNIPHPHEAEKRIEFVGQNFVYLAGSILQVAGLNMDEDLVLYLLKEGGHPQANTSNRKQVPAEFKYQHNIAENIVLGDIAMTEVNMDLLPCLWIGYFRAFARRETTNTNLTRDTTDGSNRDSMQDALFLKFKKLCLVAIACDADACDITEELLLFCAATTLSYKIPLKNITESDLKLFLRCYDTILSDDLLCTKLVEKGGAAVEMKNHPIIIKEILKCAT